MTPSISLEELRDIAEGVQRAMNGIRGPMKERLYHDAGLDPQDMDEMEDMVLLANFLHHANDELTYETRRETTNA